ncbi:MAG: putative 6-carboxyhexanoate--COA ligase [Pseudonocardiales bacterium]|nr:putative 6-carboxyhexanoate--COA ligase [Pseudonocardiales bacterium]
MRPPLDLQRLIAPASVAVIGASVDPDRHTGRTMANLIRTGYAGEIFPVNPTRTTVMGRACYPSIEAIGARVDTAYLMVRAAQVRDAVASCTRAGVPNIVVCTSGFGEMGADGTAVERELASIAHAGGSRVLGPNCIGVLNITDNFVACPTLNITHDYTPGPLTIISQSGGMGVNLLNRAQSRRIGIRALISVGNECDIDLSELVDSVIDDDETRVIALFVEQIRDGAAFIAAAGRSRAVGKPIVVMKAGRSPVGMKSVAGHTGALAGDHKVFSDVMAQLGVLEATSVDELIDSAHILARLDRPTGKRVFVMSPSGGECGYVADRADQQGLELPELSADSHSALAAMMRFANPGNPLDPTGEVIGNPNLLRAALDILTGDPAFDLGLFAIPTWSAHDADRLLSVMIAAALASPRPVIISAWSAVPMTDRCRELLEASGVTHFPSADQAVAALANLYRYWYRPRALPHPDSLSRIEPVRFADDQPTEFEAKAFLARLGLETSRELLALSPEEAVSAFEKVGPPVVLKQLARGVTHKSDLGLVRVGLTGPASVRSAANDFEDICTKNDLYPQGILVAEQIGGIEVIVGGVWDDTFGPVIMIGAGGILAEYLNDVVFRLAPLSAVHAKAAIEQLAIGRILAGARGVRYDLDALATLVARASEIFAAAPWLSAMDLNPVIVRPLGEGGAAIVDAVLEVRP